VRAGIEVTRRGSSKNAAGTLAAALVLVNVPATALAQSEASVTVTSGTGAEQCPGAPDLERLSARIASIERPMHRYHVSFASTGGTYQADVIDTTSARARHLADHGPTCAPLGQAVALVLATMWGSEQADAPPPPPPPPPPSPTSYPPVPSREEEARPPSTSRRSHEPLRWSLGIGGGIAAALVRAIAPGFVADAAVEGSAWSIALGALWVPDEHLSDGAGFVDVQLLSADARLCGFLRRRAHFGACGRFFAGALFAGASGYAASAHQTRPWFAGALELFLDAPVPLPPPVNVRYRLAVDGIVPVHAETFSVTGAGTAYDTPAFGGLLTLSFEIGTR